MRRPGGLLLVLFLGVPAPAQNADDPFRLPEEEGVFQRATHPGARERIVESLALLRREIARAPSDLDALERARTLLEPLGRELELTPIVRKALETSGLSGRRRAGLRGLLGHLVVAKAGTEVRWVQKGRGGWFEPEYTDRARLLCVEAVLDLRAAIAADPTDARSRRDLARALEILDESANEAEITKLRNEADAIRLRSRPRELPVPDLSPEVQSLRAQATELETREEDPEHERAVDLRKRALVLDFCSHTVPFAYEPAVYEPVSLLAPEAMVQESLTRNYRKASGDIGSVPARYYPPTPEKRVETARRLGKDRSACAAAALLALVRHDDPLAGAAADGLAEGAHPALAQHLPALLQAALRRGDHAGYSAAGRRHLVRLAARLKLPEAAPVLVDALEEDDDLFRPLGIADAIGRIGRPEDAEVLAAFAGSRLRDVYFRREAVYALGHFAPERLAGFEDDPALEIAVAAARYRANPEEAAKGRILAGLGREHEVDESARYSVELGIREALPLLETFLEDHEGHYAVESVRRAIGELRPRPLR